MGIKLRAQLNVRMYAFRHSSAAVLVIVLLKLYVQILELSMSDILKGEIGGDMRYRAVT